MLSTNGFKIILGSQSPRRKELLQHLNISFQQEVRPIDESYPNGIKTEDIAVYLAEEKGKAFVNDIDDDTLVITADTIVSIDDRVLEKPSDPQEAFEMIQALSNRKHTVYSGVAITSSTGQTCFYDATDVYFRKLEDREISYYIEQYKPFDKAGGYAIQEWIGHVGIEKIEGSFYTVMGLPLHILYNALQHIFNDRNTA